MANTAFSTSSSNTIAAQPAAAGEKLVLRSDNASDTGNATVTGLVAAVATAETNALTGKREVQTAASFTSLTQLKLSAAQTGIVYIYGQGIKAVGDVRVDTLPANNDTLLIGLTGFTQTYTFKTTLTGAANEIKIAASINAQATNIYEAINAGANAGTDYGTGTAANAYVTASAPVAAVVTLTDKIAVSRQLAWALSQGAGATISIRTLVGGATGALLAIAAVGVTQVYNSFTLSAEDITVGTLPALLTPTTAWINTGGKACSIRFKMAAVSAAIAVKYQTTTDQVNVSDGATAISNLGTGSITVASPRVVIPAEGNIEYIRLVFTTNANTTDTPLDARVIF